MDQPNTPQYTPYPFPPRMPPVVYPTGKGELLFGLWTLLFSLLLSNSFFFAGAELGFAVGILGIMGGTVFYLTRRGHRFGAYEITLVALCAIITLGFIKSDDGGMKFLMGLILLTVPALAFCIAAGQNRYPTGGVLSLLDSPRATFTLGVGRMGEMGRGVKQAFRSAGKLGNNTAAIAIGALVAVPVMAIMIPLLMSADAAFEGLLDLLPEFDLEEALFTAIVGGFLGVICYTRGVALHHDARREPDPKAPKGIHPLTVNTILFAVAAVYLAYLFSQLAYFVGGFSGILPEDFTLAEYARRGFFEMAELAAINLGLIALAVGLVKKEEKTPLVTRIVCLFIGVITLFLVATASAKMFMYIGSYGLTRARVMTEVFMLWLAVTTVAVCVWLFRAKLPYIRVSLIAGLILCAGLFWADVDAQVARYNVRAYQTGKLETVDVEYLSRLSSGAVPWLDELAQTAEPDIAREAQVTLAEYSLFRIDDLRAWNWTNRQAREILEDYQPDEQSSVG